MRESAENSLKTRISHHVPPPPLFRMNGSELPSPSENPDSFSDLPLMSEVKNSERPRKPFRECGKPQIGGSSLWRQCFRNAASTESVLSLFSVFGEAYR